MASRKTLRERLVSAHIEARGVRDPLVLAAMRATPRELFVPADLRPRAYENAPLPIGAGQTISQPYIVAAMVEALSLRGGEKVLEVGAGSGYAAAVLARIAGEVFAIERVDSLAKRAAAHLQKAGCENVLVRQGDGTQGWPEAAPFDAILVSAGAPDIPKTLAHQLKVGGRLVIPVGADPLSQQLLRIVRVDEDAFEETKLGGVYFVPLIGTEGWRAGAAPASSSPPPRSKRTAA